MRYVALLRGVNVGGKKMPMAELRKMCGKLKLENIETYIQSGNVVLDYDGSAPQLETLLEKEILKKFGMEVEVIVRTASELDSVIRSNPFGETAYVIFLADVPEKPELEGIDSAKADKEEYRIRGKEIYLSLPEGYGRTKLTNNFFEAKLKVDATTRNLRTVNTLLGMAKTAKAAQD